MKLFFWKNRQPSLEVAATSTTQNGFVPPDKTKNHSENNREKPKERPSEPLQKKDIPLEMRRYKVLSIKEWCEQKLTPLAYARILVRLIPVIREYDYDFADLQHPTEKTRVNYDLYLIMRAAIKEIYQEEYTKPEVA